MRKQELYTHLYCKLCWLGLCTGKGSASLLRCFHSRCWGVFVFNFSCRHYVGNVCASSFFLFHDGRDMCMYAYVFVVSTIALVLVFLIVYYIRNMWQSFLSVRVCLPLSLFLLLFFFSFEHFPHSWLKLERWFPLFYVTVVRCCGWAIIALGHTKFTRIVAENSASQHHNKTPEHSDETRESNIEATEPF